MSFFIVPFRCVLFASAATRRRLRETIYHERKARRCMCYTKCSEVPGRGKGMDMGKPANLRMVDSQPPCLRCLVPSNNVTNGFSPIFQDPPTFSSFLAKTRAGQVAGSIACTNQKEE